MNGVSQVGVEERRQQQHQQVRFPPRPQSAKPVPSPKPVVRGQGVTNAWAEGQNQPPAAMVNRFQNIIYEWLVGNFWKKYLFKKVLVW